MRRHSKKWGVVLATLIPVTSFAAGDRTGSGSSTATGTANSTGGRAYAITNGLRMTQEFRLEKPSASPMQPPESDVSRGYHGLLMDSHLSAAGDAAFQRAATKAKATTPHTTDLTATQRVVAEAAAAGPRAPQLALFSGNIKTEFEELWLEVSINHQVPAETVLLLRDKKNQLLVNAEDLKRWRLQLPAANLALHDGGLFYRLDTLSGLSYQFDAARQHLDIDAQANLFKSTSLAGIVTDRISPTASPPGGFLNYDLFADSTQGHSRVSGLVEAGAFGTWGTAVTTFLGNSQPATGNRFVRLDSTLTRDFPDELRTLRLGDTLSSAGGWARAARLGGIQLASNFAVQPEFLPFPLPGMSGEAAFPSTLDYYFNGALRLRREVPSGPFSIQDLPVLTGQGEARLVVRDLFGREQIVTQRFYTSAQLLRQGLQAYSYELGYLRNNFGLESNDYHQWAAVGTHRYGFTNQLTGEIHAEFLAKQQTLGFSGAYLKPEAGLFSWSVALSRGGNDWDKDNEKYNEKSPGSGRTVSGALMSIGFDRQSGAISFGANTQRTSANFMQLGFTDGMRPPIQISQAFASIGTETHGSVAVSYAIQQWRDRSDVKLSAGSYTRSTTKLATATYSVSAGKFGFLGVSVIRSLGPDSKTTFGANLTVPLGGYTSASVNAVAQAGASSGTVQMQRNLPTGAGIGYRVLAGIGQSTRLEAGISAQNDIGTYGLEVGRASDVTAVRGSASGGLAFLGGNTFAARRITDSFALVNVPGFANVRVFADNQLVGTTDENGYALVPRMRPYQRNAIRIDESDLPLDARIDATRLDGVPYFRSGIIMRVPVKKSSGGIIRVALETGEVLPAGAVAQVVGSDETFPSGLRGEIYLTGLGKENRIRIFWQGQQCLISVPFPESPDPVPDLGTFQCIRTEPK